MKNTNVSLQYLSLFNGIVAIKNFLTVKLNVLALLLLIMNLVLTISMLFKQIVYRFGN